MHPSLLIATLAIVMSPTLMAIQAQPTDPLLVPDPTLKAGDLAPPLHVSKWFEGTPVTSFEPGKSYLVEFWATWCGPCIRGIPHLNEFQKANPDVEVISIAVWQREETQELRNTTVGNFVQARITMAKEQDYPDLAMHYAVAVDDDRRTANAWLAPAGRFSIPSSFLVGKDGRIEWVGHPYSKGEMVAAHASVQAATWDRQAFNQAYRKENAFVITRSRVKRALRQAQKSGDLVQAMSLINRAITIFPTVKSFRLDKFILLQTVSDDARQTDDYARTLAQEFRDDPASLNLMAWTLVDDPAVKHRNLDLALEFASKADTLENHEDSNILDTLARVYWELGDHDRAVSVQKLAVEHAKPKARGEREKTLLKYQRSAKGQLAD